MMNVAPTQIDSRNAARRGTSLVEILVVLVILVFGILSVIRLFPAGFLVFRAAQNNGVGQRLGQSLIETVSKDTSNIADGVYIYNDALGFDPNIAPDDLGAWKTDPANAAYSDINKARYIQNETVTIPAPRQVAPQNAAYSNSSVYAVNYGPMIVNAAYGVTVVSAPWKQLIGSSLPTAGTGSPPVDQPLDLLPSGQAQYLVDYAAHQIAVPVEKYARTYEFSVKTDQGVGTFEISAAANYTGDWEHISLQGSAGAIPDTAKWIDGSAVVYRNFQQLGGGQQTANLANSQWSAQDPYQYQLRYDSLGPAGVNYGVLDFNPLAGGGNGTPPLKARISYQVYNWHVLHEDHSLPVSSQDRTIRLGIDNLKKTGDVQHDQSLYPGIFGSTTIPADLVVCNLDTGFTAAYDTNVNGNATDLDGDISNSAKVGISYKGGRVTFPSGGSDPNNLAYNEANPTPNSNGVHIRLYYMGAADWGVALQKAPASYGAAASMALLTQRSAGPPNFCYYPQTTAAGGTSVNVYFPFCDYGKTVEISNIQYQDTSGAIHDYAGSTNTSAINHPFVIGGQTVGYVQVAMPNDYDSTKPVTIGSVRGVSANAIVVWRENDQWKRRIVDTLLPRN